MKIDIDIDVEIFNEVYLQTYKCKDRYLLLYGGAGSGKSEWAAQKILLRMLRETGHHFLLVRKVAATIRNSQIKLLKTIVERWNMTHLFEFQELSIKCKINGNTIISSGLDDVEKLKSIAGITGIWIEEATELTWNDFSQLKMRLRGKTTNYKQIILTFNPIDVNHWIRTEFFPGGDVNESLYRFAVSNKDNKYRTLFASLLRTTFEDNKYLTGQDKTVLTELANEDDNTYNVYALGKWGVKSKGVIYKRWQIVKSMPERLDYEFYGLDFGFSNPAALNHIGIKDGNVYVDEMIYEKGLTNPELIQKMEELNISRDLEIFADAANPDKIKEIYNAGYNIFPANKAVNHGLEIVSSLPLFFTENSENTLKEVRTYTRKVDKNGNVLDEPVKFNDHSMDAVRYGVYTTWLVWGDNVYTSLANKFIVTDKITTTKSEPKTRSSNSSKYDKW